MPSLFLFGLLGYGSYGEVRIYGLASHGTNWYHPLGEIGIEPWV